MCLCMFPMDSKTDGLQISQTDNPVKFGSDRIPVFLLVLS